MLAKWLLDGGRGPTVGLAARRPDKGGQRKTRRLGRVALRTSAASVDRVISESHGVYDILTRDWFRWELGELRIRCCEAVEQRPSGEMRHGGFEKNLD